MSARVVGLTIGVLWLAYNTNFRTEQTAVDRSRSSAIRIADSRSSATKAIRRPLRGDFPEYRPGARASGRETLWR